MKPRSVLRTYRFRWWQLMLYEVAILSLGISIGAWWPHVFRGYVPYILLVFVILAPYIIFIYLQQATQPRDANNQADERQDSRQN